MCWAALGTIGGAVQGGFSAGATANSLEAGATNEEAAANERAARIRAQGQDFLAEQRVQQNAGSIDAGSGSALEVGHADAQKIELDALTELYGGVSKGAAMRAQAESARRNSIQGLFSRASKSINDLVHGQQIWGAFGKTAPGLAANRSGHKTLDHAIWGYSAGYD